MQQTITNKLKQLTLVIGLTLIALCLQLTLAPKAHATTYNINTVSNPTGCGFLEALAEINATPIPGATCATASAPNTINVAAGTYTLPAIIPPLTTDGDLSIVGENPITTIINGGGFSGIFINPPSASNNYSVSNLTFENFNQDSTSGVLYIYSGSIIVDSIIAHDNTCADFFSGGPPICALFVSRATNSATLMNSAFYNNTALAVVSFQPYNGEFSINVINNTFSNNNGLAFNINNIENDDFVTANIINNTFANNNINLSDYPFLPPSVFGGASTAMNLNTVNDFASPANGNFNIKNNILSGNTLNDSIPANCQDPAKLGANSNIISQGGNVSSDNTCDPYFTATNDKNSTDPLLQDLVQNNNTFIRPIGINSPAYNNAIASGAPSNDQRGVARPQNGAYDSGAYELEVTTPGLPNTGTKAEAGINTLAITAGLLVLSGIAVAGYSLKRK